MGYFVSCAPALILLALLLRRLIKFDAGDQAIHKLAEIVTYAMAANISFVPLEIFTAIYSDIPEHVEHFQYVFFGIGRATPERITLAGGGAELAQDIRRIWAGDRFSDRFWAWSAWSR